MLLASRGVRAGGTLGASLLLARDHRMTDAVQPDAGAFSARFRFADWPNPDVPRVAAGVYAIWREAELIYCGMSGRSMSEGGPVSDRRMGLVTRLHSHASGRLSGDQFCVYVANRLVLPQLTAVDLQGFASGEHTLDAFTRTLIRRELTYSYCVVPDGRRALALEARCRQGSVFGQKPLLNPLHSD